MGKRAKERERAKARARRDAASDKRVERAAQCPDPTPAAEAPDYKHPNDRFGSIHHWFAKTRLRSTPYYLIALAFAVYGVWQMFDFFKGKVSPPTKPVPVTALSPNAMERIEDRLQQTGPAQLFHIEAAGDFAPVFSLLESMTETKDRIHLSPVSLTLKVNGPRPDQVTYKERLNVVDATAYVRGLRTEDKYPLEIAFYLDDVVPVGSEGMSFSAHVPAR